MTILLSVVAGLGAAILLLTAGYLFGVRKGREARAELRGQSVAYADELSRLRARISDQRHEDEGLRNAIQSVLTPLVQRERIAFDLSHLEGGLDQQRDLTALLDQIAEKGNLTAVLLSDEQGLPLAASSGTRDLERLGATASLMMLLADRLSRDGSPAPLSLMLQDSSNRVTLCRLFEVEKQRLAMTVYSLGGQLTSASLDPALVKLHSALLNKERAIAVAPKARGGRAAPSS